MARHNFDVTGSDGKLLLHDLNQPLPALEDNYDVLLAPSSLYYVSREDAANRLKEVNRYLRPGALVYLRMRLPDDHRYGRGAYAGKSAWILDCGYTGEAGLLNVFWSEFELINLLGDTFGIPANDLTILKLTYENRQGSMLVRNSDIVLWGRKA